MDRRSSDTERARCDRCDRTVRRKDLTTSEARTGCDEHRYNAPPGMLTGQSKRACLRRQVPIDHEAHGQRGRGLQQKSRSTDLCSGVGTTQLRWDAHPEAEANRTTHARIHARALSGADLKNCDIIEECRKKFDDASQWLLEDWISTLAK